MPFIVSHGPELAARLDAAVVDIVQRLRNYARYLSDNGIKEKHISPLNDVLFRLTHIVPTATLTTTGLSHQTSEQNDVVVQYAYSMERVSELTGLTVPKIRGAIAFNRLPLAINSEVTLALEDQYRIDEVPVAVKPEARSAKTIEVLFTDVDKAPVHLKGWQQITEATGMTKASLTARLAYGHGECELPNGGTVKRISAYKAKNERTPITFTLTTRAQHTPIVVSGWNGLSNWIWTNLGRDMSVRSLQSLFYQRKGVITVRRSDEHPAWTVVRNETATPRDRPQSLVEKPIAFPTLVRVPVLKD